MTPGERIHYHKTLWPAACLANEWDVKDQAKRHEIVLLCMTEVHGPLVTTSAPAFGRDEVTALFCYLEHLAAPDDLNKSLRWDTCIQDYHTFNRARQADWHERKLYGRGSNKLDRNRFAGATTASAAPIDDLNPEEVRKRHLTFASRHQKKDPSLRRKKEESTLRVVLPPSEPAPIAKDNPF